MRHETAFILEFIRFLLFMPAITDFDWSWDGHIKAGILLFCLNVVSFAIDGGTLVCKPSGSSLVSYMLKLAKGMRKSRYNLDFLMQYL